ncbi:PTS fructose transporter subunit IIBC [Marinobacter nanhaiticus D15-8W]|uniref:protein-N(pi)-phosphohistidine--D-fructose phosphotransferase n=1 Tax=Marinobacter nanhaiticus D15-8W TaxID=626887 RepID=N6WVT9_9GAMM|nr:fructose-specific PTS transporter subunit EIIC [Marinobacter nanhaiticus]ENO15142.1 PTS fructose transporter subunit EIIBC [Marinobacter nanhaiticus D15-8W]BES69159.1 PTS fructose transporter subunit IIBC [Marinobacter nanhaiticus D15-8W]
MKLILVTACPQGLATSFLAARAISRAAEARNWSLHQEVHTQARPVTPIPASAIAEADLVIVAANAPVDLARFFGKPLYQASPTAPLADPEAFLDRAQQEAKPFDPETATPEPVSISEKAGKNIVSVTACPTGVAHTFMAAEAMAEAARAAGHHFRVETQGSVGAQDALTDNEIADADLVILACDIEVDPTRFAGKRVWRVSTGAALKQPAKTLADALEHAEVETGASKKATGARAGGGDRKGPYKHLLTGVSFMLPMVVAGGLMIALSFVFGINAAEEEGSLAAALMQIGGATAFKLMIPLLAGYIAYSIADRPGIAPGMIGGFLAGELGAGFLGGIFAGFIAGYVAKLVSRKLPLPESVESLKPVLIIPLIASLVTGLTMIYLIGEPIAGIMDSLTAFLTNMGTGNAVLLGSLLGAMMCFDLGGPVNKAAYTFGVGLLSEGAGASAPMAAIMASGMVPAIGMGIASLLARNKFAEGERQAGKASFVLGLCFISEGAIPFMAKDPLRVIPICMVGGAITGALSMYFGISLMAPHGGLFVLLIPNAVSAVLPYLFAITVGSLVIGLAYATVKTGKTEVAATA